MADRLLVDSEYGDLAISQGQAYTRSSTCGEIVGDSRRQSSLDELEQDSSHDDEDYYEDEIKAHSTVSKQPLQTRRTLSSHYSSYKLGWKRYLTKETIVRFYFDGESTDIYLDEPECDRYISYKRNHTVALPHINASEYRKRYFSLPINQVFVCLTKLLTVMNKGMDDICPEEFLDMETSKPTIIATKGNFLKKALCIIKPTYAAEPFYAFGIELICVRDMEMIYQLEGISEAQIRGNFIRREETKCSKTQIEFMEFIRKIYNKSERTNKHFLSKWISTIFYSGKRKFTKLYIELKKKYSGNVMVYNFCSFLEYNIALGRHTSENFNESDLATFLISILNYTCPDSNYRSYAHLSPTLSYYPFRHVGSDTTQTQHNTPVFWEECFADLGEFQRVLRILTFELQSPTQSTCQNWIPPMKNVLSEEKDLAEVNIDTTLLWQVKEQLVATLLNTNLEKMKGADIIFQGNVVVCNDRVRSIVLAMNGECYNSMKTNKCARDTLQWIMHYVRHNKKMWARLYVDANDYSIVDVQKQVMYTYKNFCKIVSTEV